MSATGRGSEREENDEYFTRYPVALAICEQLRADWFSIRNPRLILEPSAGRGAFVGAAAEILQPSFLHWNDRNTALMLREHRKRAVQNVGKNSSVTTSKRDYLTLTPERIGGRPDLIIGNPPYTFAEEHVRKSIELLADDGILAFLLRLNFLAGIERGGDLYQKYKPSVIYVLDKRPTFKTGYRVDKNGKRVKVTTDSCEYGVFVWKKSVLDLPPLVKWIRWSHYLTRFKNDPARIEV